jgi:hypothetical protein
MLSWSNNYHGNFHVIPYKNPAVRFKSIDKMLRFYVNDKGKLVPSERTANLFEDLLSQSESAVILRVFLKFIQNDFNLDDVVVYLEKVFLPKDHIKYDEYSVSSGTIPIVCFPMKHGTVEEEDALIYKPVIPTEDIHLYAGLEKVMLRANIVEVNDVDDGAKQTNMYEPTHPLVLYMLKQDALPKEFKKILHKGTLYYVIPDALVKNLQQSLKIEKFEHIHYTTFERTKISTNVKDLNPDDKNGVVLLLQIDYLLVNKN